MSSRADHAWLASTMRDKVMWCCRSRGGDTKLAALLKLNTET